MRKHLAIVGLAAVAGLGTSCVDLNEEIITGVTSEYYRTPIGFEALVNSDYESLRYFYGQERGFTLTVFGTDEFTEGSDGGHKFYNRYTPQLNGDQTFVRETWDRFYRAINSTNATIDRAPDVKIDETLKAQRVAEARFLRAFYFFHLVQMYGDVPLPLNETLEPSTEATRTPAADVYKAIIADLEYAESKLPTTQRDYGRATQPATQFLLAKVYLTRAQPGDMAKAATYAKKVIDSKLFSLLPRFKDVFEPLNDKNAEVVWSVQYTADPLTNGADGNKGHLYFVMEYDVLPGMKRDVANGRPFRRFKPNPYLLNLFDRTKDSRYEGSFKTAWISNNDANIPKDAAGNPKFKVGDTAVYVSPVEVTAAERAAKPYRIYAPSEYNLRIFPVLSKFLDPNRPSVNQEQGSRDVMIFRLADAYLMAAEALVRDGKAGEALPYINTVRRRAALPGKETAMEVTAADLTLDFILDERSRELAGESMRWFDLTRTGKLVERVKKYNADAAPLVQAFHLLRPIPTTQLDRVTTAFAQNPGY